MFINFLCKYLFLFVLIVTCSFMQAQAKAALFTPGFKTLGIWQPEGNIRVDVGVWYPSTRKAYKATYGSWEIIVAKDGKKAEGVFPIILLSHGSAGGRFSYHTLAAYLARNGFIVISPTHYGDNINNMNAIYTIYQITGRIQQLNIALNKVLKDKFFKDSIDKNNIGVLGFGVGGTTALIIGGANPTPKGWEQYCDFAERSDPYCAPWARSRIDQLILKLHTVDNFIKPQVKAVAIITPSYGMLFDSHSSQNFTAPLLIVKAEGDTINRAPLHADAIQNIFYDKATYVTIKKADSFALMSPCPPDILKDLTLMCTTVSENKRQDIHSQLYPLIKDYFTKALYDVDRNH